MHIATLTVGQTITIRSRRDSQPQNTLRRCQSALVSACFGAHACVRPDGGFCPVAQLPRKRG